MAFALFVGLAACVPDSIEDATPLADAHASHGLSLVLDTTGFDIMGQYFAPQTAGQTRRLWVVIEGDGARWRGGLPPSDPTPRHPMGPSLLQVLPKGDARLYLARPCQYLPSAMLSRCAPKYWSTSRFSNQIVAAYDVLINQHRHGANQVILVGFSGGGVLAAELALRRPDLAGLITIAAPLDLVQWSAFHGVPNPASPTPPINLLSRLAALPVQKLFLFGGRDTVVPNAATRRVRQILPPETIQVLPSYKHTSRWEAPLARWVSANN